MLKNKFVLTLLFILAFMVFLVPQSNAAYEYNGVTLPDLPGELPSSIANIEVSSFDYMIYDRNSTDNAYNLYIFYYVDDSNIVDFYLYGDSNPSLVYIDSHSCRYFMAEYWYIPGQHTEWVQTSGDTKAQTGVRSFDFGNRVWLYSSFDIYTDSSLETIFFQKTPSTTPLYQIVGEMVEEETPKMAAKILAAMKTLVVFSISCLAFLILLPVFSRVFSTFQVK